MPNNQQGGGGLKTACRSFRIIERLRESRGLTISELASEIDIPKSTAHRYLTTLDDLGYLTRNPAGRYEISFKFLNMGIQKRNNEVVYSNSKKGIKQLAEACGERVQLAVEEQGKAVLIYGKSGSQAIQTDAHIGQELHLHTHACGKAILAYLDDERIQETIQKYGLPQRTENTITSEDALITELEKIREEGIAFNDEERIQGIRAIGAPIRDGSGHVMGSISISGLTNRMSGKRYTGELPELLSEKVNEIELHIQYDSESFD